MSQFAYSDNKNIRHATATILLNYSIVFLDKPDPEGAIQLVSAVGGSGLLQRETDAQTFMRFVTMLGNVVHAGDQEARELVLSLVGDELRQPKGALEGGDEKTTQLVKDIIAIILKE